MKTYTFWNNKGGTGKTSLCFQCVMQYALDHPQEKILVVDMCPQANLSELMCGGMEGNGVNNLANLYASNPHKSVGGYFDLRIMNPFNMPAQFVSANYIDSPHAHNQYVPQNVDLLAGDPLVELQVNNIASLATQHLPTADAYFLVVSWLNDFIQTVNQTYNVVFLDTNPSFSIYTQMAIAATDKIIIPVTADGSSIRALHNVLSLVYGINVPQAYTHAATFSNSIHGNGRTLPLIHLVIKNRLTQYMGTAAAYQAVLNQINQLCANIQQTQGIMSANFQILEVKDFQTVGVVAYAKAEAFEQILTEPADHLIGGNPVHVNQNQAQQAKDAIDQIVALL